MALPLAETETITICDREADIYEMFALAAEKTPHCWFAPILTAL
jgi:hypothetical protein